MSKLRVRAEWSVALFGWASWLFRLRPVVMMMLWHIGLRRVYVHMIRLGGVYALVAWLGYYRYVICGIGWSLMAWNRYNKWRYGAREQRSRVLAVAADEAAALLHMPVHEVLRLHAYRDVTIQFQPEGQLVY